MMSNVYKIVKLLIFFLLLYFFYRFIDKDNFILILKDIKIYEIFIIFAVALTLPFLITYRWFIIINNFSKISFKNFFNNVVQGLSLNILFSSSIALEVTKFIKIYKEVGKKNSFLILLLDKFFTLFFKVIVVLIFLLLYINNFDKFDNYLFYIFIFFLLLIILFYNSEKILIFLLKKLSFTNNTSITKIISVYKNNLFKLVVINSILQIINIFIFFLIFKFLETNINLLTLSIFVPLIELFSQLQFLIIGMREISTIFLFGNLDISYEISLAGALIFTFVDVIILLFFYLVLNFKNMFLNYFDQSN